MNWEQLQAIVWLRWRLSRNRFARAGALNNVLAIFVLALLLLGGAAAAVGGFLLGFFAMPKLAPPILLLAWDGITIGFLFFWLTGLVVEIQRSESIDLPKLLHLPVTLKQVFVFNYVASHFTPSIVLLLPAMVTTGAGLALAVGLRMAWVIPLALSFVFMISAWTYCLRGWLSALMVNKRRRKTVIVWITVIFIMVGQIPNLLVNYPRMLGRPAATSSGSHSSFQVPEKLLEAHLVVPIGWVGYGAMSLREQRLWPAWTATAAAALLGAWGLIRAYKSTLRFYRGVDEAPVQAPVQRQTSTKPLLVERRLPWIREDTAALTLATLRSLLRAPELKLALVVPVVFLLVFGGMQITRVRHAPAFVAPLAAAGAAVMATFSLVQNMSNLFGLDRDGFRALMLLPIERRRILLAKNLALFPFAAVIGFGVLTVVAVVLHMQPTVFLAGLLQIPAAYFGFSAIGNLASILAPYRVAPGSLQAKKPKAVVMLTVMITMLLLPLVLGPVAVPALLEILWTFSGGLAWLPVNLIASVVLLGVVALVYRAVLPSQGRLLQRREQTILREVTEEIE